MRLLFAKTAWEVYRWPLARIARRAAADGFTALELHIGQRPESPADIRAILAANGLALIAQIGTDGGAPADHEHSLRRSYEQAVACAPFSINSNTGRDIFPTEDNLALFRLGAALEEEHGIPLQHETHRSRALFSGPETLGYLSAMPSLKLTADFSHWCCVHESDLADQPEAIAAAVAHATHVHARVGHSEGPQITDPRAPESQRWLDIHVAWWKRIAMARKAHGADVLTISPEFGPPPYQPVSPGPGQPADPWELNVWMRDHLRAAMVEIVS